MRTGVALLVAVALVPAACARGARYVPPATAKLVVVPVGLARPDTRAPVAFVEVASTGEARQKGLGGRPAIEPGEGMLFVYGSAETRRYWMKGCLVGLDIAFLRDDGTILSIATLPARQGVPDEEIPGVSSPAPVRFVLETAAGWLSAQGLAKGDEVDLSRALEGVTPR